MWCWVQVRSFMHSASHKSALHLLLDPHHFRCFHLPGRMTLICYNIPFSFIYNLIFHIIMKEGTGGSIVYNFIWCHHWLTWRTLQFIQVKQWPAVERNIPHAPCRNFSNFYLIHRVLQWCPEPVQVEFGCKVWKDK